MWNESLSNIMDGEPKKWLVTKHINGTTDQSRHYSSYKGAMCYFLHYFVCKIKLYLWYLLNLHQSKKINQNTFYKGIKALTPLDTSDRCHFISLKALREGILTKFFLLKLKDCQSSWRGAPFAVGVVILMITWNSTGN